MDEFTEQKIIYSLLETIRNSEINDDERMTEAYLRNILYTFRAEAFKGPDYEFSEEIYQRYNLTMRKDTDGKFSSDKMNSIIFSSRLGVMVDDDMGNEVSITSREEAYNSLKSRFFQPYYIGFVENNKLTILANLKKLVNADYTANVLLNKLNTGQSATLEIRCILADPTKGNDYNWAETPFPFDLTKINTLKQNILRKEFGIMYEVKKDEIQNARADNIIYQDESKLYK